MCDPLGKNLLIPSWFIKDFEEESSASSLGIFRCMGLTREESSTSLLGYFGEESSASPLGIYFGVLGSIRETSSASSMGMMLDMPEFLE